MKDQNTKPEEVVEWFEIKEYRYYGPNDNSVCWDIISKKMNLCLKRCSRRQDAEHFKNEVNTALAAYIKDKYVEKEKCVCHSERAEWLCETCKAIHPTQDSLLVFLQKCPKCKIPMIPTNQNLRTIKELKEKYDLEVGTAKEFKERAERLKNFLKITQSKFIKEFRLTRNLSQENTELKAETDELKEKVVMLERMLDESESNDLKVAKKIERLVEAGNELIEIGDALNLYIFSPNLNVAFHNFKANWQSAKKSVKRF